MKRDFHFSQETARALSERRGTNDCKSLYRYCVEYQLNNYQKRALEELQGKGVTNKHLRGRDWFNTCKHIIALECLLNIQGVTAEQAMRYVVALCQFLDQFNLEQAAMQKLSGLGKNDVRNICHSLSRNIECKL